MIVLIKIIQFVLSLSIIVIIHELGHFIFAKLFKTRVEKFYLFFDPWFSLFKVKRGETEYGMGWLPLGGYVKISGMIDESMDKEQMKKPPQPWEFRSKPTWQRLLIMVGGVLFNFILALFIYVMVLFSWGETYLPTKNVTYGIVTDSVGLKMGFKNGDNIVSIDGEEIEDFFEIIPDVVLNEREVITVERDGKQIGIRISDEFLPLIIKGQGKIGARIPYSFKVVDFMKESPAREAGFQIGDELIGIDGFIFEFNDQYQNYLSGLKGRDIIANINRNGDRLDIPLTTTPEGMIGIEREGLNYADYFEFRTIRYSFPESVPAGITKGFKTLKDYLKQFKIIFSKQAKGYESLGGFITIGRIFPGVWNWQAFWNLTAFLSIILGIMNVLPIPALDGGHLIFLLYEVVTGRKPSDKFLEYSQITGMILLLALLLYANGNDIIKYVLNK
ncbi:MAG TPA: RIP metalloprotease RseP [Bacteroidales bacterium]|nr:RIP metalloprotease RseP [Bacteroidales bacterium]